jgi:hypothetical protein
MRRLNLRRAESRRVSVPSWRASKPVDWIRRTGNSPGQSYLAHFTATADFQALFSQSEFLDLVGLTPERWDDREIPVTGIGR